MAQIFHPSMNTLAKASIALAVLLFGAFYVGQYVYVRSPYVTLQGVVRDQPVPFSHEHHVRGLGINCQYCHTSVEQSWFAGLPPTKTCMSCHSKIWTDQPILQPVRDSWKNNTPIAWQRVHKLPDYVYFNHSVHVNKGVGCQSCHGQVDQMPLMYMANSLQMEWCLNCHRDPSKYVRPRDQVYNINYDVTKDARLPADQRRQDVQGPKLVAEYHIPTDGRLTTCWTCHR